MELHKTNRDEHKERVTLVGVKLPHSTGWEVEDHLDELRLLAESAGAEFAGQMIVKRKEPDPAFYIGSGKADELHLLMESKEIDTVLFDDDLSPAQQRNLEEKIDRKVIDRTELILDIFAKRARTREAKLQIELAQLKYIMPRLIRMWTHLSKQYGGIGTKGPGETQLEVDRRRIRERIGNLTKELAEVRKSRTTQRKSRRRNRLHTAVLVGYTNAGKSTLLNSLTGAGVEASSRLFSTLDPISRKRDLPSGRKLILSDTVGFIRKLPHHLVESFMATFEEVVDADLLLHVLDASDSLMDERSKAVYAVLEEIGFHEKPVITVLNKIDKIPGSMVLERYNREHPFVVAVSALESTGLDELLTEIDKILEQEMAVLTLIIPQKDAKILSMVFNEGEVIQKAYHNNCVLLKARVATDIAGRLEPYVTDLSDEENRILSDAETGES